MADDTQDIQDRIREEADAQGVPPDIALAVAEQESSFNQGAVGTSGEHGVFQIMPDTADDLGVDPTDLDQNIEGGIRYLKQLNEQTGSDWEDTLTAYNGGIGNLQRGTTSAAAREYPKLVNARRSKYQTDDQSEEEQTYAKPPPVNQDVPANAKGFSQILLKQTNTPEFDALPFAEQAKVVSDVYKSKKWDRDSYNVYKDVMSTIWDGANPDDLPDIGSFVGAPPITPPDKKPEQETAKWKTQVIQDLHKQGISPGAFGNRLDAYLNQAAQDEIEAYGVRNEGFIGGSIAAAGNDVREAAKGAISVVTAPAAGITRLAGAYETADAIQELPELLGKPRNSYLYETKPDGRLVLDDEDHPVERWRGQIAQMVGNVGATLAGGFALRGAGVATSVISKGLFSTNALASANQIFKETYDRTGNSTSAYTASLFALPVAGVQTLGNAAVISKFTNPVIKGLGPYNQAKYLASTFARAGAVEATTGGAGNVIQQGAIATQTDRPIDLNEVAINAVGSGLAGGALGAFHGRNPVRVDEHGKPITPPPGGAPPPDGSNPLPPVIPAPVVRGTEDQQIEMASKLEEFQKAPAQELVLTPDEASKVHPELLNTFALDVTPEGENYILRKKSTHIPVEPAEELPVLDAQIGKLNKELIKDGTPDEAFGLTDKLATLKKQYADIEASIGPTTAAAVKGRNVLDAEVSTKRAAFDEQTDPILRQVAYSELQDAKTALDTFDSANESIFELPNKLGEIDTQIQETKAKLENVRRGTYPNDISNKQANLEGLLRKKKSVIRETKKAQEEARQKALDKPKPTAEGEAKKAAPIPEVQTTKEIVEEAKPEVDHTEDSIPVGNKHIKAVNGKWYVLNKEGNVTSKGHDYFAKAERAARGVKEPEQPVSSSGKELPPIDDSVGAKKATGLKNLKVTERFSNSKELDTLITRGLLTKYIPQSHEQSAILAEKFINDSGGIAGATKAFFDLPEDVGSASLVATAVELGDYYSKLTAEAKAKGDMAGADAASLLSSRVIIRAAEMLQNSGQTVDAGKMLARISPDVYLQNLKSKIEANDLPGLTPEQEARLKELSEAAQKQGGIIQQNTLYERAKLENEYTKGAFFKDDDALYRYFLSSLLSDPSTKVVNLAGNTFNMAGSALSFLTTGLPVGKLDGLELIKGMIHGATREGFDAALLERTGIRTYKPLAPKEGPYTRQGIAEFHPDPIRDAPNWMKKTGLNYIGYVLRALSGDDAFFYKSAREGMARMVAYDIATKEGLSNSERKARMSELLYDDAKSYDDAMAQAKKELKSAQDVGLLEPTGGKLNEKKLNALVRNRAYEIIEAKRDPRIRTESINFGHKATYTDKPQGAFGLVSELINKMGRYPITVKVGGRELTVRPFRYATPFMSTAANILNAATDYVAPISIPKAYLLKNDFSSLEKRNMAGKAILGTVLASTLYSIAKQFQDEKDPYFALYTEGPKDPAQNALWRQSGAQKYSAKFGDKYFKFSETPVGPLLGAIGSILNEERYNKNWDTKSTYAAIKAVVGGSIHSFLDNSFLKSIGETVAAATGGTDRYGRPADPTSILINISKGFSPAVGMQRAVSKMIDDPIHTTDDLYATMISGTPAVQRLGTKPAINDFGEPVERTIEDRLSFIGRFYSERVTDPAYRWMARTRYTPPSFQITGAQAKLMGRTIDSLRYEMIETAGPLIKKRIEAYANRFGDAPLTESQEKALDQDIKAIRSRVRKRMLLTGDED